MLGRGTTSVKGPNFSLPLTPLISEAAFFKRNRQFDRTVYGRLSGTCVRKLTWTSLDDWLVFSTR